MKTPIPDSLRLAAERLRQYDDQHDGGADTARIKVVAHRAAGYALRTKHNADSAGLTVAVAIDFTTAGERLTARVAQGKYLAIPIQLEHDKAGLRVAKAMRDVDATTLNIAGNGIHTLAQSGWTQAQVNQHVYDLVAVAHSLRPITKIVTGGQTGVDIAGAIAAYALGIPTVVTMPAGFKQRGPDGLDYYGTAKGVTTQIIDSAAALAKGGGVGAAPHSQAPQDGAMGNAVAQAMARLPDGPSAWRPIESAPRDGTMVLVNDTTPGYPPWVAASYLAGDEWSGWVYDDATTSDSNPLGPNPTHWLPVPPVPQEASYAGHPAPEAAR